MAYDKRELALKDQRAAITHALEKGRQEGELKGRQEGELKGRQEGELKGRYEGEQRGEILGRIVTLQELLSVATPTREELSSYDLTQLTIACERLQKQLRDRGV